MRDQSGERRGEERIALDLPIKVQILHPTDTMARKSFKGMVSNFNERGARLTIFDLSVAHYGRIIKDVARRYVRLTCVLPSDNKEIQIYGRMNYFHFHNNREGGNLCIAGVNFSEVDKEERKRIQDFVHWLDKQDRAERKRLFSAHDS